MLNNLLVLFTSRFAINGPPSSAQTEQMLELAFNHHPLVALIVPKTVSAA